MVSASRPLNPPPVAEQRPGGCLHCGQATRKEAFCCHGCEAAYALLNTEGLADFYRLRDRPGLPVGDRATRAGSWLDHALDQARATSPAGQIQLTVDLEGLNCAACVWVIQTLFDRREGRRKVLVNPGRGQMTLWVDSDAFDVPGFLEDLATLGYRSGPASRRSDEQGDDLLLRVGVATAIAMNTMILSGAFYLGLAPSDGLLPRVFVGAALILGSLSVMLGLPVFARGAAAALRRGAVHLDLPIALGIALAWAGSTAEIVDSWLRTGSADASYFDTLTVFVALMLFGRWLQRRAVARNRRLVLDASPEAALFVRRLVNGRVDVIPARQIEASDELLIVPGDYLPVRAAALEATGTLSLAWISGESDAVLFENDEEIPAGAHHRGDRAFRVRALETLHDSALFDLLRTPVSDEEDESSTSSIARLYVTTVLALAVLGGGAWAWAAGWAAALNVVVAVLVVSCPCAIGLALPLARELSLSRLRQQGVFVRRVSVLDRLGSIRRVVFDKTGTLTRRRLMVRDDVDLRRLDDQAQWALSQMVLRSRHPVSATLAEALDSLGRLSPLSPQAEVREQAGLGMSLLDQERRWALRRRADPNSGTSVSLLLNDQPLAQVQFDEELRPSAKQQVRDLQDRGLDVAIYSGDAQPRVSAVAERLGIPAVAALGRLSPADKASLLEGGAALMLGDGLNDGPAMDAAAVSGAVPGEDGALWGRADFFLLGEGLQPLSVLFGEQRAFARVVRRNLAFALTYNAAAVALALAGLMSPLLAALAMPLSSIAVILHTGLASQGLPRLWAGPAPGAASAEVTP